MPHYLARNSIERYRPTIEVLEDRCLLAAYFVAPAGSDQDAGTFEQPFATIQHALDIATNPGDVINVRAGVYREKVVFSASGSSEGGYITLQAFAGEQPILNGRTVTGNRNMVLMENVSFVKLIGFEIKNNLNVRDGSGVRVIGAGSHIEIRDNRIHEMRGRHAMGITVYGTSVTAAISDLIIDGNEIFDSEPARSEALTLNGNVTNFEVTDNFVHDVNSIGIDFIGGEADINPTEVVRNGLVSGNKVVRARSSYGGGFGAGIYVDGARDIIIENNIVRRSDLGIEVGAENPGILTSGIIVRNNLIYLNDKAGLVFGGFAADRGRVVGCSFINNTVFRNDTLNTGFGQLWIQFAEDNIVTSNIFRASGNNVLLFSEAGSVNNTLDHNLWFASGGAGNAEFTLNNSSFAGFAEYQQATGQDASSLFGNPLFVDAPAKDFHLLAGSPAIDLGSDAPGQFAPADFDGLSRPQGPRPDAGAFEAAVIL